jgi:alcohol dehydrogenase class IV
MAYEFHWPTKTLVGPGVLHKLPDHVQPQESQESILIVAPRESWVIRLIKTITESLTQAGWEQMSVFQEVEPNPSWDTVENGIQAARSANAAAVLALGGGSSMDAGKVIADRSGARSLYTVPTTAGTGGEISPWAVISNLKTREKDSVVSKWPDMAFLDPELTITVPPPITLFTGIDAFIHGLEAYLASAANPITDALAFQGMSLVAEHIEAAVENGSDLPARSALLQGSLLTGASMLHAGLGLMHAIGNVTGGLYHKLPHGLVLTRCMDAVLEFNQPAVGRKYLAVQGLVDRIRDITNRQFSKLTIPQVVVSEQDLQKLAKSAVANVNAATNPRPATADQVIHIVRQSFTIQ